MVPIVLALFLLELPRIRVAASRVIVDDALELDASGRCTSVSDVAARELATDTTEPSSWRACAAHEVECWQAAAISHRRWVEEGAQFNEASAENRFRPRYGSPHVPLSAIRVTALAGGYTTADRDVFLRESADLLRECSVPTPPVAIAARAWFEGVHMMPFEVWCETEWLGPSLTDDENEARHQARQRREAALRQSLVPKRTPLR
jgi:hypothetical protein